MQSMLSRRLLTTCFSMCLGIMLLLALPSWGLTLEEAKGQGLIGEQLNGYLGLVQPAAASAVKTLVNEINQKRRDIYADIAQRNGTSLEAVQMLAGKTAIEKTSPGHFIQDPSGRWRKK